MQPNHGSQSPSSAAGEQVPWRAYLNALSQYAGLRLLGALLLLGLVGVTEGIGLLMLVPFLYLVGLGPGEASPGGLVQAAEQVFAALRLPLTLPVVLLAYVALVALRSVLVRWREVFVAEIQFGFVDHLRTRLYHAIGQASWLFLSRRKPSDFEHVLIFDIGRVGEGTTLFLNLIVSGFIALVHVAVALKLSVAMTLIALLTGAALSLVLWPQVRRARELGVKLTEANRALFGTVAGFLDGIKLAKSYGAEARHTQAFRQAVAELRGRILGFLRMNSAAQMIFQIGGAAALASLFYLAAKVVRLPAAELLVFVLVFARLLPMFSGMQRNYQGIVHMLPAYASAGTMEAECIAAAEPAPPIGAFALSFQKEIRLENISFCYDKKSRENTLSEISLSIPSRRTIALVGPSGAGKSTLADLLVGLLAPDQGRILVDGETLGPEQCLLWRRCVAYVPQETFLFHDTIRSNLLWARPDAGEPELWQALRLASAEEFVAALPERLETIVGERGVRLSGGERQRLALARAVLCKPSLLVLDEATSALDSEHELLIQQAIEDLHGELTIVIIAHRLSTVRHADHIVVLERGRVVETGRWEELGADVDGRFHALLEAAGISPL
jgi:ATP-binding cassette subfamily C protein